jgi:hypothetical protein
LLEKSPLAQEASAWWPAAVSAADSPHGICLGVI